MSNYTHKDHWENVYETKSPDQVSWTQDVPLTSLNFIQSFGLDKKAKIIDIGGGDSHLVDHLLSDGYTNITVLDISQTAIAKAKARLGDKAQRVTWIVSDITEFEPIDTYDIWHDRAAFHFLTTQDKINTYLSIAQKSVHNYLIMGTFSEQGPLKCSGLDIMQYTDVKLTHQLRVGFDKIRCINEDHVTPFGTTQNFLFCSFKKQNIWNS
jgi:SAM-dependent methyltransferase